MNSTFETAKEHFLEHGYCNASLKDIDLDFYNYLETNFLCDENNNLQDRFHRLRFDSEVFKTTHISPIETYQDCLIKKEEFLKLYKDGQITQCWYISYRLDENDERNIISKGIYNICKYFYDLSENDSLDNSELQLSYYDKGCFFKEHRDGASINLCSIIIYLNKDYKKENGGLLLLNGEEIVPEFGNIGLMDLSKHNISHGVTKVIDGPGRYAILDFPKLKNTI
jgi:Rps23 Pro-64 3,4-dihydroxylase Tpa1-like proline 4-hydroxylase